MGGLMAYLSALFLAYAVLCWAEWRFQVSKRIGIEHLIQYPWPDLARTFGALTVSLSLLVGVVLWT